MQPKKREISLHPSLLSSLQHSIGFRVAKIGHWFDDGMVMLIYYYSTQQQKCNSQSSTTLLCFASRSLPLSLNFLSKLDPLSSLDDHINLHIDPALFYVNLIALANLFLCFGVCTISLIPNLILAFDFTYWILLSCTRVLYTRTSVLYIVVFIMQTPQIYYKLQRMLL